MACLYNLIDPRTGLPFYVGFTDHPTNRFQSHLLGKCNSSRRYIRDIKSDGFLPYMSIIADNLSRDQASQMEGKAIRRLSSQNIPLGNYSYNTNAFERFQAAAYFMKLLL